MKQLQFRLMELGDWPKSLGTQWSSLSSRLVRHEFNLNSQTAKTLSFFLKNTNWERTVAQIKTTNALRTILALWLQNPEESYWPTTADGFEKLTTIEVKITRGCYYTVLMLWLNCYMKPDPFRSLLREYVKYVGRSINAPRNKNSPIALLKNYESVYLAEDGPIQIVQMIESQHFDLQRGLEHIGLTDTNSLFESHCRALYFLPKLQTCPLGQPIKELTELAKPEIYKLDYQDGWNIGQEAVRIMIDRTQEANIRPSDSWLQFMLKLTKDPRLGKSGKQYSDWWLKLTEMRRQAMVRWMASEDLKLFLDILENFASDQEEMLRMFLPRKQILISLLDTGIIKFSHLFLSRDAHSFVQKNSIRSGSEVSNLIYSIVATGKRSFIYLDLENAHLVEGTHNAKVHVYKNLWNNHIFDDFSARRFAIDNIRPNAFGVWAIAHSGNWKHRLVNCLTSYGVDIEVSDLITDVMELDNYRSSYGYGSFEELNYESSDLND